MLRSLAGLVLCAASCGRSQGVSDEDLGGLVVTSKAGSSAIDVDRAGKDPAELGRALMAPYAQTIAVLGPHELTISTQTTVDEAGKRVSDLADTTKLVIADQGAYHATYENSADYGREVIFASGRLYLRPRYQRWHARGPEAPDEPATLRDQIADAIGATWDLLAPGVELTDRGTAQVDGRAGHKIEVKLSPKPQAPPPEPLSQRKWREQRSVDAVSGEIVIDADKGVPLSVKLTGTVAFSREGKRYAMKVSLTSAVSAIGKPGEVSAPATDVVATPERLREVDDRDLLLQGIAPPLRKSPDGTAVQPAPAKAGTPAPDAVKDRDKSRTTRKKHSDSHDAKDAKP
jgi:hypothetical protein